MTMRFDHAPAEGGVEIARMSGTDRRMEIPEEIDGMPVVSLGEQILAQSPGGSGRTLVIPGTVVRASPETLEGRRYAVLDGVQDPGNVGTILRTADAFHADGLFLVNACADLYNPKTVRASMGAVFRCPVWACTLSELRALLTKSGLPLYGAALRADTVDETPSPGWPPAGPADWSLTVNVLSLLHAEGVTEDLLDSLFG